MKYFLFLFGILYGIAVYVISPIFLGIHHGLIWSYELYREFFGSFINIFSFFEKRSGFNIFSSSVGSIFIGVESPIILAGGVAFFILLALPMIVITIIGSIFYLLVTGVWFCGQDFYYNGFVQGLSSPFRFISTRDSMVRSSTRSDSEELISYWESLHGKKHGARKAEEALAKYAKEVISNLPKEMPEEVLKEILKESLCGDAFCSLPTVSRDPIGEAAMKMLGFKEKVYIRDEYTEDDKGELKLIHEHDHNYGRCNLIRNGSTAYAILEGRKILIDGEMIRIYHSDSFTFFKTIIGNEAGNYILHRGPSSSPRDPHYYYPYLEISEQALIDKITRPSLRDLVKFEDLDERIDRWVNTQKFFGQTPKVPLPHPPAYHSEATAPSDAAPEKDA